MLKKITKILLFITLAIPLFVVAEFLFFPFISGKVYLFRLFVQISFLVWVVLMIKKPEYRPNFKNPLIITTLLLLLGMIITGFLGVDPVRSFFSDFERGKGVIQFGHWVLYFLMLISVLRTKKDWQLFLFIFIAVALLISIYAWFKHSSQPKLYGTFGNPSYLAGFLIFAIGFTAVMLERRVFLRGFWFKRLNVLIWFLLGFFFILTLIFTQTRGAYASLGAGFVLLAIFSVLFLRKEKKKLVIVLSSILIIGLIFMGLIFVNRESQFVKSRPMLRRTTDIVRIWQVSSVEKRLLTWQIALKALKDKPVFGWGMENFQVAFNKHYDYRIGLDEPWFDRVHNQSLQYLADGGIFLFSLYLLWLFSVFYLIFKIFKKKKLLAGILGSIFVAYLIQGLFLFDTLSLYMGLFTFLGFTCFQYQTICGKDFSLEQGGNKKRNNRVSFKAKIVLAFVFCLVIFLIYTTVWIPHKANSLTWKYYAYSQYAHYQKAQNFFEQACKINSPYSYFEVRKRAGWEFVWIVDARVGGATKKEDIGSILKLYKFITPELEKAVDYRSTDPQLYYVLGKIYRMGTQKLGQNDLSKAETILKKSLNCSQYRIEYFNELARVLLLQGKFEEAEKLIKDYTERIGLEKPFSQITLGHFYFVAEKYELAMKHYEEAREKGYDFLEVEQEYSRYLSTAEKLKDYEKIIEMCLEHLKRKGPEADTYFNLAVSYRELGEHQKAKEYFSKAVELDKKYEEYKPYFEIL